MQTLEIKVSVDITNPEHMAAASQFLATLGGIKTPTATLEVVKDEPAKPKRKRRTKAEIEADKAAKETPESTPTSTDAETQAGNQTEEDNEGDAPTYKIADVRTKLSEKVGAHRAAIKDKLKELEAKNVSSLKEADYGTFMDFLNGLS